MRPCAGGLLSKGLWSVKRRHRSIASGASVKPASFGELVQMDGSHHDWFEGRRAKAVLMVMIDDATQPNLCPVL